MQIVEKNVRGVRNGVTIENCLIGRDFRYECFQALLSQRSLGLNREVAEAE